MAACTGLVRPKLAATRAFLLTPFNWIGDGLGAHQRWSLFTLLIVVTFLDRRPGRGGRVGDWLRRFRVHWLWLALGVCLHLGIALTLRLGIFPFGVLALYPLLLQP